MYPPPTVQSCHSNLQLEPADLFSECMYPYLHPLSNPATVTSSWSLRIFTQLFQSHERKERTTSRGFECPLCGGAANAAVRRTSNTASFRDLPDRVSVASGLSGCYRTFQLARVYRRWMGHNVYVFISVIRSS
ncbi:hypothetical protein SKAU_G00368130 [Synaphobranchus kaupii]|uniref:Uncharacterized protein n=1 Tax=Synaphobranchus kaupii TaxID=118154 RepID=A0A9Q1IFI8_SYNKA|nr:hypothetical protein SKAU_G00368130 [Synaphobranchus kaupii]